MSRNLLLVSSSRCHPAGYLDHCAESAAELFGGVTEIIFVPYARPGGVDHDAYTATARGRFESLGIRVRGLHEFENPAGAVEECQGMFIGGGNTFVLLKQLYEDGVVDVVRRRIESGMPYMGTSAGSNIAGMTIGSSNDMPIVHPPSFNAFAVVPFNINPHYPRAADDPTHMGETRDDRIGEFHIFNEQPVVAIREDGMLRVIGDTMTLMGKLDGYVFRAGKERATIAVGADLSELLVP
ncbi:UNVERIFIED_CONTAM: hypothetical protein GTU68_006473 [Idotea baltica]|nr:hypothetical protein [Idotea baltica]